MAARGLLWANCVGGSVRWMCDSGSLCVGLRWMCDGGSLCVGLRWVRWRQLGGTGHSGPGPDGHHSWRHTCPASHASPGRRDSRRDPCSRSRQACQSAGRYVLIGRVGFGCPNCEGERSADAARSPCLFSTRSSVTGVGRGRPASLRVSCRPACSPACQPVTRTGSLPPSPAGCPWSRAWLGVS